MSENLLAKNIMYYRKKKGLSQEKVSEYMGVSRQAVTKWENDISRPSSDNLIKLARLFEVSVEVLLDGEDREETSAQTKISTGKMPWIFIGISVLCICAYVINSALLSIFSMGTLICMFVLCLPIQVFLHIYFSNAIAHDSFNGIAGFDDRIEYNYCEVKKMLVQINLQIGIMSTVYIFLFCVMNCMDLEFKWLNGFLIVAYTFNCTVTVLICNYKMIDKIYRKDDDKKRAKNSMPITAIYVLLIFVGMGMVCIIFEIKGIENNTIPALKTGGLLILGVIAATIGFIIESNQVKRWNPSSRKYEINKVGIISLLICVILYGLMCVV